jgi:hypothetical protein
MAAAVSRAGSGDFDEAELSKVIKQYTNTYADYGKCRQREVAFHLNQLEKVNNCTSLPYSSCF